jgi:hypothetical protein
VVGVSGGQLSASRARDPGDLNVADLERPVRSDLARGGGGRCTVKLTTKSGRKTITRGAHKVSVKKTGTDVGGAVGVGEVADQTGLGQDDSDHRVQAIGVGVDPSDGGPQRRFGP